MMEALESLGEIYHTTAQYQQADESFGKASDLALKTGEQPAKLAELQYWRAESLHFLGKHDKVIETGEIGLSFLAENLVCPQAANIFQVMGFSYRAKGDHAKAEECWSRNAAMIHNVGYYDNIFRIYTGIAYRSALMGDIDVAIAWQEESLNVCQSHGNDMGVAEAYDSLGMYHSARGDLDKAVDCLEKSITLSEQIGYAFYSSMSHLQLAAIMLRSGDDLRAEEHLRLGGGPHALSEARPLEFPSPAKFARIYLDRGNPKAIQICTDALMDSRSSDSEMLCVLLGVMEEAYEASANRDDFISFCHKLREEKADVFEKQKLAQWYLEPMSPSESFAEVAFLDHFDEKELNPEWRWINPKGDCSCNLSDGWLEMRAALGRNLYGGNLNAPRLMLEISGDFAIETKMAPVSEDMLKVGGLLVWKDERNFIRFEKGMNGKHEIGLSSNVDGDWQYSGRGLLVSSTTYLRLERSGDTFKAYCSGDGISPAKRDPENRGWLTCGEVSFAAEDPIQIAIHAIGGVSIHIGNVATATRFDYFKILR
jgi:hypothetical protein